MNALYVPKRPAYILCGPRHLPPAKTAHRRSCMYYDVSLNVPEEVDCRKPGDP